MHFCADLFSALACTHFHGRRAQNLRLDKGLHCSSYVGPGWGARPGWGGGHAAAKNDDSVCPPVNINMNVPTPNLMRRVQISMCRYKLPQS